MISRPEEVIRALQDRVNYLTNLITEMIDGYVDIDERMKYVEVQIDKKLLEEEILPILTRPIRINKV